MKKKIWIMFFLSSCVIPTVMAQESIGIGTANAHSAAMLDIESSNKGVLFPRLALNETTVLNGGSNPLGIIVFNNGEGDIKKKGFYFWQGGSKWELLSSDSDLADKFLQLDNELTEKFKNLKVIINNPSVSTNEVIDNKLVYIGRYDIKVVNPINTNLSYNTTIETPLAIANFEKVVDAKIYDSSGELVLQNVTNVTSNGGVSFYFGSKNIYSTLPIGDYQVILKYVSNVVAN
ncbi:hypothetical protein [Myroides odoratus]|uniref:hypothetical protein n=1 Tax=Myroides odoratus TaxID=256 RepID=UPI0039AEED05